MRAKRKRSGKPVWQQEIARERIMILMGLAESEFRKHPERSHRYADLARKIGMRYNVPMPREARRICKGCHRFMVPGRNSVVRANPATRSMESKCMECGRVSRHPYAREKSR